MTVLAALISSLLLLFLADVPAPPAIEPGGIVNSASLAPSALPGGSLAPGARFRIPGVRLGPSAGVRGDEANPPSHLADVSVRITWNRHGAHGGADAGLFFVSARRIDAWMPDGVPVGDVFLTVTYEGRASEPYRLHLVPSTPGLYSEATSPNGIPGGSVTLRATGLGRSAMDVFVGGLRASTRLGGRQPCCRGIDLVELQVPSNAPLGCAVPVVGRVPGGHVTNTIPIALHLPGQPCHDQVDWFGGVAPATAGFAVLARVLIHSRFAPDFAFDYAIASFVHSKDAAARLFPPFPPLRTCTVYTAHVNVRQAIGESRAPEEWGSLMEPLLPESAGTALRLDAGPALAVSGVPAGGSAPAEAPPVTHSPHGYYSAVLGGEMPLSRSPARPLFLGVGRYSLFAPGGADMGSFTMNLDIPPNLIWTNRNSSRNVTRSRGATVEWKSGRSEAAAIAILAISLDRSSGASAVSVCLAPADDGRFTVPPVALANLPRIVDETELAPGYLMLAEIPVHPSLIQTRGLGAAPAMFISASLAQVRYR